MQFSPNFSLAQLTASDTAKERGIDNAAPPGVIANLKLLAAGLEKVQALLGAPLDISSGYRCPVLNEAVGGAASSQHVQGLAVDFVCPDFGSPLEVARAIVQSDIDFDQCILEFGRWVHLSFSASPRGNLLSIYDSGEGYLTGLWNSARERIA